jgi:hypothetical protein
MSAIFVALIQIRARRPCRYLIVTDSMSFLKVLQTRTVAPRTHSLVYEIIEACWWLKNNGYDEDPVTRGSKGQRTAYQLADDALENGMHLFDLLVFFLCLG